MCADTIYGKKAWWSANPQGEQDTPSLPPRIPDGRSRAVERVGGKDVGNALGQAPGAFDPPSARSGGVPSDGLQLSSTFADEFDEGDLLGAAPALSSNYPATGEMLKGAAQPALGSLPGAPARGGASPAGTPGAASQGGAAQGADADIARIEGREWDQRLNAGCKDVEEALAAEDMESVERSRGSLADSYQTAQKAAAPISKGVEQRVQQALGEEGGTPGGDPAGGNPAAGPGGNQGPGDGRFIGPPQPSPAPNPDVQAANLPLDNKPWTDQDRQLLDPFLGEEQKFFDKDLLTTWAQGSPANCVSIAEIKAGMATYGNKMFDQITPNARGGYDVTMQDGYKVSMSGEEMDIAKSMSGFRGAPSSELAYAQLAYAAEAKRAQEAHEKGATTYKGACQALNTGEWADHVAKFLGLSQQVRRSNGPSDSSAPANFGANATHQISTINRNGRYDADMYGRVGNTAGYTDWMHFEPKAYPSKRYTVKPTSSSSGTSKSR